MIAFRNLDDPSKYMSSEYAMIAVDEVNKNRERTFHILRGSLRWPGFADTRFIGACNPDPGWVRAYWIEKNPPELEAEGMNLRSCRRCQQITRTYRRRTWRC